MLSGRGIGRIINLKKEGRAVKLLICIDDTDNLESRGTGTIAEEISSDHEKRARLRQLYD